MRKVKRLICRVIIEKSKSSTVDSEWRISISGQFPLPSSYASRSRFRSGSTTRRNTQASKRTFRTLIRIPSFKHFTISHQSRNSPKRILYQLAQRRIVYYAKWDFYSVCWEMGRERIVRLVISPELLALVRRVSPPFLSSLR